MNSTWITAFEVAKQKIFQTFDTSQSSSSQTFCSMHVWVQCGPKIRNIRKFANSNDKRNRKILLSSEPLELYNVVHYRTQPIESFSVFPSNVFQSMTTNCLNALKANRMTDAIRIQFDMHPFRTRPFEIQ